MVNFKKDKPKRDYHFQKSISREVLENYLSRAVTQLFLLYRDSKSEFEKNLKMLSDIGAKFIGRAAGIWNVGYGQDYWNKIQKRIKVAHQKNPDFIFQTCLFETVHQNVEQVKIPEWVWAEFEQKVESRTFNYTDMLYTDGTFKNHWGEGLSVPDMSKLETRMWFYYRAVKYINSGIEAIHFGQVHLMDNNDPNYDYWYGLLNRIRKYAQKEARRGLILADAHTHGIVKNNQVLFDFHSFPLRPKEVENQPQNAILEINYLDSIYQNSCGGITPGGWYAESMPFLAEMDNFGGVINNPGQCSIDSYTVWGYDEISWFARQSEKYRNQWLKYAWDWIRENDANGYFQMVTKRTLGGYPVEKEYENKKIKVDYYRANQETQLKEGFNQQKIIKKIWNSN
ncbi:MAG: hypothetical protein ACOCQA_00905 [bacterium]